LGLGIAAVLLHEQVSWSMLVVTAATILCVAAAKKLFNTGLVARHLSRLAGIPKPANCL
jgi:sulfur relay (sulfurtransferase) DsrC/TusE family protein